MPKEWWNMSFSLSSNISGPSHWSLKKHPKRLHEMIILIVQNQCPRPSPRAWCVARCSALCHCDSRWELWPGIAAAVKYGEKSSNIFNQKKQHQPKLLVVAVETVFLCMVYVNVFYNFQWSLPKSHRNNLATRHADEHDARVAPHITTGMPFLLMSVGWASPVVFISGGMLSLPFEAQCGTLHPGVCCVCFAKCKF